jgi:Flp pilus assembly protein TadD
MYEPALAEMERTVALAPNDAEIYAALAVMLSSVGRSEDALRLVEQALRRKPPIADAHLGPIRIIQKL